LDHITDKLKGGKHWIEKKLQIAAEAMLLSSADYDHHLHDNPRLQEPEAQADVPSPFSNTGPGPAGLLQDSEQTASSNEDQSLLPSGHFRRCIESLGSSENPSAHLNASEEQLQVSSLQFLVTNTSLVGLSECGNIEP
jgi:hypothetical protein